MGVETDLLLTALLNPVPWLIAILGGLTANQLAKTVVVGIGSALVGSIALIIFGLLVFGEVRAPGGMMVTVTLYWLGGMAISAAIYLLRGARRA